MGSIRKWGVEDEYEDEHEDEHEFPARYVRVLAQSAFGPIEKQH